LEPFALAVLGHIIFFRRYNLSWMGPRVLRLFLATRIARRVVKTGFVGLAGWTKLHAAMARDVEHTGSK
jgi:hypothetical protein